MRDARVEGGKDGQGDELFGDALTPLPPSPVEDRRGGGWWQRGVAHGPRVLDDREGFEEFEGLKEVERIGTWEKHFL
jgi:hypothetical protein